MTEDIAEDMSYKLAISLLGHLETTTHLMNQGGEQLPTRDDIAAALLSAAVSLASDDEDVIAWSKHLRGMLEEGMIVSEEQKWSLQ